MAHIVMAYNVMACIVIVYIVMAYMIMGLQKSTLVHCITRRYVDVSNHSLVRKKNPVVKKYKKMMTVPEKVQQGARRAARQGVRADQAHQAHPRARLRAERALLRVHEGEGLIIDLLLFLGN